ncbi:MAG: hypothetical protein ACLQVI_31715 [Polyangiaceae bacterium]
MNPSLVLTLAAGLLLLLTGITSGRHTATDDTAAPEEAEGPPET